MTNKIGKLKSFVTYYVVIYENDSFKNIKNVIKQKSSFSLSEFTKDIKRKVAPEIIWEVVSSAQENYEVVEYLFQFKHNRTLADIHEKLEDISSEITSNLEWIWSEVQEQQKEKEASQQ